MSATAQIPRGCIIWLLLAQCAAIIPHIPRISWWMLAIWLLCAIWRLAMFRGEAAYPSFLLRVVVVCLGSVGIAISFGRQGVLDIAVAALIFAFSLKLIEVKKRRDLYLVFYLALFVVAASFLYSQSLFLVLYQCCAVLLILSGMVATQQSSNGLSTFHSAKVSLVVVGQAVPLLLLMFFLFPRIGPIWSVAESDAHSNTGMSESMAPGDLVNLSQSRELVFTVDFHNAKLAREDLYWRGMTYEAFDGREWSRGEGSEPALETKGALRSTISALPVSLLSDPVSYEITYSRGSAGRKWLFALPLADLRPKTSNGLKSINLLRDFNYETLTPSKGVSVWSVRSHLDYVAEPEMSPDRQRSLRAFPKGYNPRARRFAVELWQNSRNEYDFVAELSRFLAEEPFYYSLQAPELGRDSVDDFIFSTRTGFCEHYASAAAFLLRAAGIPARIVAGYQGGEQNNVNATLIVRQLDAHAWVEYWVPGDGWIRFDPTAAVAPDRVRLGLDEALRANGEERTDSFVNLALFEADFMRSLRHRIDALNYAWQRAFVGYDYRSQAGLLQRWLGEVTLQKTALVAATATIVCLLLLAFFTLRVKGGSYRSKEDELYKTFCDKLAKIGFVRKTGEAPQSFAKRVAAARPDLLETVQRVTCLYQQLAFQGLTQQSIKSEFAREVKSLRLNAEHSNRPNIVPFRR